MQDDSDLFRLTRRLWLQRHERVQPLRWRPAADVYRQPGGWLIKLELAGVPPEQIEITVCGRRLVVHGRRRDVTVCDSYACHTLEIAYSEFERGFELPADLERADLEMRYQHGMLLVSVTIEEDRR